MEPWIVTAAQKRFDLHSPEKFDWNVECVAHSLSQINRYTGHTPWPYSVAQHSWLIAEYLYELTHDAVIAMEGLWHDAHEIVIGDISSPVKRMFSDQTSAIKTYELQLEQVVANKRGLPWPYDPIVKDADIRIALNEKEMFFPDLPDKWQIEQEGLLPLPGIKIHRMDSHIAAHQFIGWHTRLERRM